MVGRDAIVKRARVDSVNNSLTKKGIWSSSPGKSFVPLQPRDSYGLYHRGMGALTAAEKQVAPFDQGRDLAVGDRAFIHPETAIGIDPFDAPFADDLHRLFDPLRHVFRRFDGVHLYIDHTQADADARIEVFFEVLQLVVTAKSHFEQHMIAMQEVDEADQFSPLAFLDRLAAVIAEAHVRAFLLRPGGVENDVDRGGGPFGFVRVAGDLGFVNLARGLL